MYLFDKNANKNPGVAQLVARLTGGQEAAGSSPVTRTKNPNSTLSSLDFSFYKRFFTFSYGFLLIQKY